MTCIANIRKMWQFWLIVICATGISCTIVEPQSFSIINPTSDDHEENNSGPMIRRFACPVGFFRLYRKCYYLSAGTATWQQAHFHCKDRNSTLAAPDKRGKDRKLRKYLMGEQFAKFERWIGGIYDWRGKIWRWGVSGEKIEFDNFDKLESNDHYSWYCIVMDPRIEYKWRPMSCVERKHYICEVPAGRIERRRRNGSNLSQVPQNQRLKPKKVKKYEKSEEKNRKRHRGRINDWKRYRNAQSNNEHWGNGMRLGSRPPHNMKFTNETQKHNRMRHRSSSRLQPGKTDLSITRITPQGQDMLDDNAPVRMHKAFSDDVAITQFQAKLNDLSLEEILLKT